MNPSDLRRELNGRVIRPAYLLVGEEALLRDEALAAIREVVLGDAAAEFNLDRLDGASTSPTGLLDAVGMLPVKAPRRLVVLREPGSQRSGAQALLGALERAIAALPEDSPVVVVATAGRADRRQSWVRAFAAAGAVVDCSAPRGAAAIARFVRDEARRQGVTLDSGAVELLAERVGPQLLMLRQEIAKAALLAGPGQRITRAHAAAASDVAEEPIWGLTDAIGEGRSGDALSVLGRLLDQGAPPPAVLGSLAAHIRRLLRIAEGEPIAAAPFVVRKLEDQARRYRRERLLACLSAIHRVDEVLKGRGGIPPGIALERLVMGLSA